ncbi:Hypp209 [Branchiostoma lanceolatum]|uniref:Hypp209 protein n=1 Tax=Branchiostoma lanceolatum TaxID=7740 RepID=A0A8J9YI78_BRALA|nr:Hypp209 [Branchiostoma lanceolatum]
MAKMMVYMLAVFCGLLHSAAAVPVPTVAPGASSQQTVPEALQASLQKTEHVLARTTEALGTINTVHFSGTASYPDYSLDTLPSSADIITAEDIETSTLEDSVVLQTLKAHLHIFERHLHAVKLDQLALVADDTTGQVQAVHDQVARVQTITTELQTSLAVTANVMGHPFDNTSEDVETGTADSQFKMTLRAYFTFRDYEAFLVHLAEVFAELEERESTP